MQSTKESNTEEWSTENLLETLRPLAQIEAMRGTLPAKPDGTEPASLLLANFIALKELAKQVAARMDAFKPYLHEAASKFGTEDEEGSQTWEVGGNSLFRNHRVDKEPDIEKLKALLKTRDIKLTECFDTSTSLVLNASKLQLLVDLGRLDEAEVNALRQDGYALMTTAGPKLKDGLEKVFKKEKTRKPRERSK